MATAPAADQQALLRAQDLDTQAQQAQHRRGNHPILETLAGLDARARELNAEILAHTTGASDIRREVNKAEDDVRSVRERAERDTVKLNSGDMLSKELVALQSELELLAKRQSDLEDIELEAMERLEAAELALTKAEAGLAQTDADIAKAIGEREAAFAEIDAELTMIGAAREGVVTGLDADLVAMYEKLRAGHGGVGAAPLQAGTCQGCHMNVNSAELVAIENADPDEVIRCEECGRILVRNAA